MNKLPMCRMCLVEDVRMYIMGDKNLHELYKKLTDTPFVTEDRRPMLVCFICYARLKQCYRFLRKCLKAEEQFAQNEDYEPNPLTNQDQSVIFGGLVKTTTENISIVEVGPIESIAMKEELPAVCDALVDKTEPKEEHQSDEEEPENLDNSCLDVADIPPEHSEFDLEDYVPLMNFKPEVEEVSKKKRRAREATKEEPENLDNSCLDVADIPPEHSEFDLEDYVPLMNFKPEVEEVSKKKRRAREATKEEPENLDNSCLDVADIPPEHSEFDLEDYVPLMNFKPEVEEVSKKKRRAREATNTPVAKKSKLDSRGTKLADITRAVTNSEVEVLPSTSGLQTASEREVVDGSDLDSEFNDEFDVDAMPGRSTKDIPDTEELEEPMREIVHIIDTEMDDAADRLLGTSPCFTWQSDFDSFRGVREQFSGPTPGPVKDYDSPYDAFVDIWDKDIIDLIVRETNRYAQQTIEAKRNSGSLFASSRLHSWTDTNADEIMLLFAVFMYMALDPRTPLSEYWTKDAVLQLPGFRRLLPYNRYVLLSKFLHFVDNTAVTSQQLPQTEDASSVKLSAKLGKLAPIIEHLGKKFKSLYNLEPDVSIDESLTLFKGGLSWVQTIRSKSARFGMKSHELCESSTGYMAGFQIYTGKFGGAEGDNSVGVNFGAKSTKVVLELLQGLEHRGHCVVTDNFYNCPSLARYLKSLGFDCLGTLRVCRRNVPSDIAKVPKKVSKGTIISRHCGDVSIIAWMDSKMVNIISTYHRPDTYIGTKAGKSLVKPVCVRDYNQCMGGVDLKDQKLSMYLLERKRGVKWYMKMYKRLLNVSIHNAFVMYASSLKRRDKPPVTHREFRRELAETLLRRHRPCLHLQEISPPLGELMRLRRDILHEPEYLKGPNARKRCMICFRMKEVKLVHSKCTQCDAFLCFGDCWRIWHSAAQLPGKEIRGRKRRRNDE